MIRTQHPTAQKTPPPTSSGVPIINPWVGQIDIPTVTQLACPG